MDHVVVGGMPDLRRPDGTLDTAAFLDVAPRFHSMRAAGDVEFE